MLLVGLCLLQVMSLKTFASLSETESFFSDILSSEYRQVSGYCATSIIVSSVWFVILLFVVAFSVGFCFPSLRRGCLHKYENVPGWQYAKVTVLLYVFIVYVIVGVLNYPFAYFLALTTVPFYFAVSPSKSIVRKFCMLTWWIASSPLVFLHVFYHLVSEEPYWTGTENTGCAAEDLDGYHAVFKGLLFMQSLHTKYGSMHFAFLCLVQVPLHTASLWILMQNVPANRKVKAA
mmetsp:Transcript_18249/g.22174  ORF Transcript_18249/g.22174 Transcript_18249/m.22174 type:complete len:233 (-) Transcript_18249:1008-1706(-)